MIRSGFLSGKHGFCRLCFAVLLPFLLLACGEDEEIAKKRELFESYSVEDLQAFVDEGEDQKALDALQYYRDEGIASNQHMLLLGKIYIKFGAGIAAEETVYKLRDRGVGEETTALMLAQSLVMQGRHKDAEEALRGLELPEEDEFNALVLRGDILMSLGEFEGAETFYKAAVEENADNFTGYTALALFYLQRGNLEQASLNLTEAVAREKDDPVVSYVQGMVARYSGQVDEARIFFEKTLEANPSDLLSRLELAGILISQDAFELAREQLDAIYASTPNNPMASYYSALLLVGEGKLDEAEDLLIRTGDFTREYPRAAQVYGLTTYELEKYSTAIPYLRRALFFFPNDDATRLALADSMARRGQSAEALQILIPLIGDEASNVTALVHATSAAAGRGDLASARKYIERALIVAEQDENADPEVVRQLMTRAAFARFLNDDLDGATALLDAMYADNQDDAESLTNKANMFLASGDLEQAQTALNQLMALDPESTVAANLKGAILHRQRKFDEAIEAYSSAIAKVPEYQSALKNRAFAYIQKEDYGKARADLKVLIDLAAEDPQVLAMYGRSLIETGDPEAALPFLARAVDALPNSPIVLADRAEAMAMLGYYTRAVSMAAQARRLGEYNPDFVKYIEEKTEEWQSALQAEEEADEQARAERLAEREQQRLEEAERQEAIKEQSRDILDAEDDQSALMEELERIAEENRKLRAEELKQQEQATSELLAAAGQRSEEEAAQEQRADEIRTKRNQLLGLWLAEKLGLSGNDAVRYANSVVQTDKSEPGDTDIVRKALSDLEAAGNSITYQALEDKITEFQTEAEQSAGDDGQSE